MLTCTCRGSNFETVAQAWRYIPRDVTENAEPDTFMYYGPGTRLLLVPGLQKLADEVSSRVLVGSVARCTSPLTRCCSPQMRWQTISAKMSDAHLFRRTFVAP